MSDNDDSEAREIAGTWFDPDEPITWEDLVNCAKAGIARGRVLGAREERAHWLQVARSRNAQYVTVEEFVDDRRAGRGT